MQIANCLTHNVEKCVSVCAVRLWFVFLMLTNVVLNKRIFTFNSKVLNSCLTFLTQYLFLYLNEERKKGYDTFSFFLWLMTEAKLPIAETSASGELC